MAFRTTIRNQGDLHTERISGSESEFVIETTNFRNTQTGVVNTISDLRTLLGSSNIKPNVVHIKCHSILNDGGAGTFDIVNVGTYVDDDGVIITSGSYAALRRYDGAIKLKWYGAPTDNTAINASPYIQRAVDRAVLPKTQVSFPGINAAPIYSQASVDLGRGQYHLENSINVSGPAISIFSNEGVILSTNQSSSISHFVFDSGQDNFVKGIQFVNGKHGIEIQQSFFTNGVFKVEECKFYSMTDLAITSSYGGVGTTCPLIMSVDKCSFLNCTGSVGSIFDRTMISHSWVWTPTTISGTNYLPKAQFVNGSGIMYLDHVIGVGLHNNSIDQNMRWIDNHSWGIFVTNSSFSGDVGAGIPLVYNFNSTVPTSSPWVGVEISVKDTWVSCGNYDTADSSVLNIVNGCPQKITIDNVSGPITSLIVGANVNSFLENYINTYPDAAAFMRVNITPNLNLAQSGPSGQPPIPIQLTPFCNPDTACVLPRYAQPGLVASGSTGEMFARYSLPSNYVGGPMILTLSWCPDVINKPLERLCSVYIVTRYTKEVTGTAYDFITSPDFPSYDLPVKLFGPDVLKYIHFNPTVLPYRASTGPTTGIITVVWNTDAGFQPGHPQISLNPLHLMV